MAKEEKNFPPLLNGAPNGIGEEEHLKIFFSSFNFSIFSQIVWYRGGDVRNLYQENQIKLEKTYERERERGVESLRE
ncbi:hypothetical protein BDE02_08G179600 [Populus trichocarpa]|nr:hypothetical protein BDE02_08G179600 [Populus trichocarpa]